MSDISKINVNGTTYNLKDSRIPNLPGSSTTFLRGDGQWVAPSVNTLSSNSDVSEEGTYLLIAPSSANTRGFTLLGEKNVTANTTSTSATSLDNITVASVWTTSKMIYARIRDNAGPRAGYFYGSDCFFINYKLANGSTTALTYAGRIIHRYSSSSKWEQYSGATTTGYGVYAYDINSSGRVRIYVRYNATYSLTINGTYHVEVYALDWPDGVSVYS